MTDLMEQAITRISKITWGNSKVKKKSSGLLIGEYFRRGTLFLESYSFKSGPFFSPARVLDIELGVDLDLEDVITSIFPEPGKPNILCKTICQRFLEWVILVEQGKIITDDYPNVYEPLIKYFERGGNLRIDQGIYLEYEYGAFPIDNWRERYSKLPPTDISDEFLDSADIEND
ncbi:hypothetical protein [Brevibacillus antibioticus]|uniref:hypothetical protein n=1 Tax=Brevibacillus antibioticus TaxID=2570228 RepID=UPI001FCA56E2|nr:hypothetical protein [Brevibacillus antibioticus]